MTEPEFPYVAKCPLCYGDGLDPVRGHKCSCGCGANWPDPCSRCEGEGYIIPPEWVNNG